MFVDVVVGEVNGAGIDDVVVNGGCIVDFAVA